MRALITGAAGFVGTHLARTLIAQKHEVHALVLPMDKLAPDLENVTRHECDITDATALAETLKAASPEWIFHLAAVSHPSDCRDNPELAWRVNFLGTHNLFATTARIVPSARVLFVGSAVEYGKPSADAPPLTEESPLDPQDVYAATKAAGDLAAGEFALSGKLSVIRARPFNHIGPGQEPGFVAPDFARQIARIDAGIQEPVMQTGSLAAALDFTDVRDVVRAYILMMQKGKPGQIYNVCSEHTHTVQELLDGFLSLSRLGADIEVRSRKGKGDGKVLAGSARALREATGWSPEIPFEQTLRDILDEWQTRTQPNH